MSKYPPKVRSAMAMRVVNLDRQKFNEAVANGYFPCAPSTVSGSVRLFQEDDLVVLFVFARLLELSVLPRRAGQLACEFKSAMHSRNGDNYDRVVYVRGTQEDFFTNAESYNPKHEEEDGKVFDACGPIILSIDFYASHIRKIIADRMEYENSILGREGVDD